jgi:hypothetical protein
MQRLLSSAPNALIYGESCANDIIMFTNLYLSKEMYFNSSKNWRNDQLAKVLDGQVNDWFPDLMPDIDGYLTSVKSSFFALFQHYEDFAKNNGYPIWGTKLPEWNVYNLAQVHSFIPDCKIIYLVRDIADCLRSAKAIDMVQGMEEAQQYCQLWKQNKDYALQNLTGSRVFHLNYEELITAPKDVLKKLEAFTGASDIDPSVLEYKINTYADGEAGAENGYLPPAELNEQELALISSFTKSK